MISAPDYIQLYPTLRCNRACAFCFNKDMPPMPDMSMDRFRALLQICRQQGVRTIDIMGGEPTLHPDILDMTSETLAASLRVNLSSNGSNLSLLSELASSGSSIVLGLSVNDRKELEAVKSFVKQHRPVVKSVFHDSLDRRLVREILLLGPSRFYLIYRDALTIQELPQAVPFPSYLDALGLHGDGAGGVYCSGFLPDVEHYPHLARVRCPAGTTKLGVMPDGSVYPCNLFFGTEEFRLGNILEDPFDAIWHDQKLDFFRQFQGNACPKKTCRLHEQCHGGCPAHGFLLAGDLAAPDPRCLVDDPGVLHKKP
jgi:radical SAM protein with 4Fe4S-binding SPASM domain